MIYNNNIMILIGRIDVALDVSIFNYVKKLLIWKQNSVMNKQLLLDNKRIFFHFKNGRIEPTKWFYLVRFFFVGREMSSVTFLATVDDVGGVFLAEATLAAVAVAVVEDDVDVDDFAFGVAAFFGVDDELIEVVDLLVAATTTGVVDFFAFFKSVDVDVDADVVGADKVMPAACKAAARFLALRDNRRC